MDTQTITLVLAIVNLVATAFSIGLNSKMREVIFYMSQVDQDAALFIKAQSDKITELKGQVPDPAKVAQDAADAAALQDALNAAKAANP